MGEEERERRGDSGEGVILDVLSGSSRKRKICLQRKEERERERERDS